ncbi:MAG: hypothetical protein HY908_05370 [Myxococcales bacterium]|nr:hypothetical protein [Myxococcales bacterium]
MERARYALAAIALASCVGACTPMIAARNCPEEEVQVVLTDPWSPATVVAEGACANARYTNRGPGVSVLWVADIVGEVDEICSVTATHSGVGLPHSVSPVWTKSAPIAWYDECDVKTAIIAFP